MSALLAETGISGAAWNPGKEVYSGTDGNDPRYSAMIWFAQQLDGRIIHVP